MHGTDRKYQSVSHKERGTVLWNHVFKGSDTKRIGYCVMLIKDSDQERYLLLPTMYFFMDVFWAPQLYKFQTKFTVFAPKASSSFSLLTVNVIKPEICQ